MDWRRHVLGGLGLGLILLGLVRLANSSWDLGSIDPYSSFALRVGILLSALWLALPQIQQLLRRVPAWLLGTIGVGILAIVIRPRLLLVVIPIVGVIIALRAVGGVLGFFKPKQD